MFANVNPVVKFDVDKGKLAKAKKSTNKKTATANSGTKNNPVINPECPDVYTLYINLDETPTVERFYCDVEESAYYEEVTYDDLFILWATLRNEICMIEFDGVYATWVETTVYKIGECPEIE